MAPRPPRRRRQDVHRGGRREVAGHGTLRVAGGRVAIETGPYAGELTQHGGDGGRVAGDDHGRVLATPFTLTAVQERIDVTGAGVLTGETAGTVSGRLAGPGLLWLRRRRVEPCPAELDGEATTGEGGSLAGHFRGQGCGGPVTGSFSAVRP